jgi:hypothetical protein
MFFTRWVAAMPVSLTDPEGIAHSVTVTAESLFEGAGRRGDGIPPRGVRQRLVLEWGAHRPESIESWARARAAASDYP